MTCISSMHMDQDPSILERLCARNPRTCHRPHPFFACHVDLWVLVDTSRVQNGQKNLRPEPACKCTAYVMVYSDMYVVNLVKRTAEKKSWVETLNFAYVKWRAQTSISRQDRWGWPAGRTMTLLFRWIQSLGQGFVEIPNLSRPEDSLMDSWHSSFDFLMRMPRCSLASVQEFYVLNSWQFGASLWNQPDARNRLLNCQGAMIRKLQELYGVQLGSPAWFS